MLKGPGFPPLAPLLLFPLLLLPYPCLIQPRVGSSGQGGRGGGAVRQQSGKEALSGSAGADVPLRLISSHRCAVTARGVRKRGAVAHCPELMSAGVSPTLVKAKRPVSPSAATQSPLWAGTETAGLCRPLCVEFAMSPEPPRLGPCTGEARDLASSPAPAHNCPNREGRPAPRPPRGEVTCRMAPAEPCSLLSA